MSGFVALTQDSGVPADLLALLTAMMGPRGPDGLSQLRDGQFGMGFARLRVDLDTNPVKQPLVLGKRYWISGDVRVDGRAELLSKLRSRGGEYTQKSDDIELVLGAYLIWGEDCLDHLIGDFGFAIWDETDRSLFCACDQLGVVPVFYCRFAEGLVLSNTLNVVRAHPDVSSQLNDSFIADYLLFRMTTEAQATVFSNIQRLPPGHALTFRSGTVRVRRYFEPSQEPGPPPSSLYDCIEEWKELLELAVRDRVRSNQIASTLSGGMDSTTITALLKRNLEAKGYDYQLEAHTFDWKRRISYDDGQLASRVANSLKLEHKIWYHEDFSWDFDLEDQRSCCPEPSFARMHEFRFSLLGEVAKKGRLVFSGEGGDPLFHFSAHFWHSMLRSGRKIQFLQQYLHFVRFHKRQPIGFLSGLSQVVFRNRKNLVPALPQWLQSSFIESLSLQERHLDFFSKFKHTNQRLQMLDNPLWRRGFLWRDPGFSGVAARYRFPFFDLRLINQALRFPAHLWLPQKGLLRKSMEQILPQEITSRPKTFLSTNPFHELVKQDGAPKWCYQVLKEPSLSEYVDPAKAKLLLSVPNRFLSRDFKKILRPLSLGLWLLRQESWFQQQILNAEKAVGVGPSAR